MRCIIFACLVAVAVSESQLEELGVQFQNFKVKFGKSYINQAEEAKRFSIFKDNLKSFKEHNARYELGLTSYKQGVNQFADRTLEEFKTFLAYSSANKLQINGTMKYVKSNVELPDAIDWRAQGQVTEVKNQLECGSCWAFSVTGSTEGAFFRKNGYLVSLSEQQLVDCTRDVNAGCDGGLMRQTFPYVQQYGLQTEETYPYQYKDGTCVYNAADAIAKIDGFTYFDEGDETSLFNAVGTVGPVSVAIDASYLGYYSSGIFTDTRCSHIANELNHGVLIVGYGTENGQDYWIVKNSWSANFGEQGYFRIIRDQNLCGIAVDMSYPF